MIEACMSICSSTFGKEFVIAIDPPRLVEITEEHFWQAIGGGEPAYFITGVESKTLYLPERDDPLKNWIVCFDPYDSLLTRLQKGLGCLARLLKSTVVRLMAYQVPFL